jgi:hypothetical protein
MDCKLEKKRRGRSQPGDNSSLVAGFVESYFLTQ